MGTSMIMFICLIYCQKASMHQPSPRRYFQAALL